MNGGEAWRPLGIGSEDEIAEYDALHDGVPSWMAASFWAWVRTEITKYRRYRDGSGSVAHLNEPLMESMCQVLRVAIPNLRFPGTDYSGGQKQLTSAMQVLKQGADGLQIADYILAHSSGVKVSELDELLCRSNSAWTVGTRSGKPGLVRRVPFGVQVGADAIMDRAGRAGARLASAWEKLYGLHANASEAYRLAILAVEDASVPVVSPSNDRATLGTVLRQMEDQKNWMLPMSREDSRSPSGDVLVGMIRTLWHGQHDRHGGQPSAPGNVSEQEAIVAVGLATTLVQWFDSGAIARGGGKQE